jgi:uncharacterized Fe-S cluster protein YjdI
MFGGEFGILSTIWRNDMNSEKEPTVKYANGTITVLWQPHKCAHSGICARGLPSVFQPKEKPWIQMDNASSEAIMEQVRKCPSGALSFTFIDGDMYSVQSADEFGD